MNYVCVTCGVDRGAIFRETQECPECRAIRLGHCLCTSDPGHPDGPCPKPALPDNEGYCSSCHWFRSNND